MENRLTTLEARFDTVLPTLATKADIESLRADVQKWMVATIIGLFVGFGGLFVAMTNILRPPAFPVQQQAQPPVIITIPVPGAANQP
ncbi:MAG: hypothetical protein ACXW2U_09000 [Telluria sp.]